MKLKGWGNRAYNIFFHLHTVSGITISAALFVIFLAGAFTLFKTEFYLWENREARKTQTPRFEPEKVFQKILETEKDFDLDDDTFVSIPTPESPIIYVYGHLKPEGATSEVHYSGKMNPHTLELNEQAPTTIGETLYRLHFLDQIPMVGRYIAGFISLFFVFATITGLLVHWKNMVSKFWAFSLKAVGKQLWTNAHTVFGLLGLPFQLMYAVTGAFYLLLILVLLPAIMLFYNGKPEKVYALAYPAYGVEYKEDSPFQQQLDKLTELHHRVVQEYGDQYKILGIQTHHLLREDAAVNYRFESKNPRTFSSHGYVGYRLSDGKRIYSSMPDIDKKFTHKIVEAVGHLHFATFGGSLLKSLYFLLSLFTCFIIVSGILIWKEARNNKQYTPDQKKFHHRITIIFLAISLSLYPSVAGLFSLELLIPNSPEHSSVVNSAFFALWLILTAVGIYLNEEAKLTRSYLLFGGLLGIAVPLVNGITTSDWIWKTDITQVWVTDACWLLAGLLSLALWAWLNRKVNRDKEPVLQKRKVMEA